MAGKLGHISIYLSITLLLLLHHLPNEVSSTTFTFINSCTQTIWPGILSNSGIPQLTPTGFTLHPTQTRTITPPSSSWGGRFWARTYCSTTNTSQFTCQTGDCGSGNLECSGNGATPPATLAEFTLNGSNGQDFYDVSLVDGYNLPMMVEPSGGGSGVNCSNTGCVADLNGSCPSELSVGGGSGGAVVACKSACEAFNQDEYCCSGAYGSPDTCSPSVYSVVFKKACPSAYSYAYDDKSSTFVCGGSPDYTITFCPTPTTSQKASSAAPGTTTPTQSSDTTTTSSGLPDGSMVYMGAMDATTSAAPKQHFSSFFSIGFLLATAAAAIHNWWWL